MKFYTTGSSGSELHVSDAIRIVAVVDTEDILFAGKISRPDADFTSHNVVNLIQICSLHEKQFHGFIATAEIIHLASFIHVQSIKS